jgi:hypothetical protein
VIDALRRDGDSSNTVIGIILLVMLLVFVGPNVLPSLLARTFPFIDEGVPCTRLQTAENRALHQSLIGRSATDPLSIRTQLDPLPENPDDNWTIRITLVNETIGTIPFVFAENEVVVSNPGNVSGLGLYFTPSTSVTIPGNTRPNADPPSFPEDKIRLLGPRQRCVHRVNMSGNQILNNPQIEPGNTQVTTYYRITGPGQIQQQNSIYTDQGLAVIPGGIIEAEPITIPVPVTAN